MKVKKRTLYRGRVRPRTGIWHLAMWSQGELHPICHIGDRNWVFWVLCDQGTEVDRLGYCAYCLGGAIDLGLITKK